MVNGIANSKHAFNGKRYRTSKRTLRRVFVCENMEKAQSAANRSNTCCCLMTIKAIQRTTTFLRYLNQSYPLFRLLQGFSISLTLQNETSIKKGRFGDFGIEFSDILNDLFLSQFLFLSKLLRYKFGFISKNLIS